MLDQAAGIKAGGVLALVAVRPVGSRQRLIHDDVTQIAARRGWHDQGTGRKGVQQKAQGQRQVMRYSQISHYAVTTWIIRVAGGWQWRGLVR